MIWSSSRQFPAPGSAWFVLVPLLIPVYRMNQFILESPCQLGNPCRVCSRHRHCIEPRLCSRCRHNKRPECPLATPAEPAFGVKFRQALTLIYNGMAVFIHRNAALQLTFSELTDLRDRSSKADAQLILDFINGSTKARIALELAWGIPPAILQEMLPQQPIYPFV